MPLLFCVIMRKSVRRGSGKAILMNFCLARLWLNYLAGVEVVEILKFCGCGRGSTIGACCKDAMSEEMLP